MCCAATGNPEQAQETTFESPLNSPGNCRFSAKSWRAVHIIVLQQCMYLCFTGSMVSSPYVSFLHIKSAFLHIKRDPSSSNNMQI